MNKDEIKKALECCEKYAYCKDCPCHTYCEHELHKGALDLITEQEKEIELLKMQMKDVVNHADTFLAEANKFEAENKKLKAENKMRLINLHTALDDIKQAKIDVLNKLKENAVEIYSKEFGQMEFVGVDAIDELIKEVEND